MSDGNLLAELHDPFTLDDGSRVESPDDWGRRRGEITRTLVSIEYGGLPPVAGQVGVEPLHSFQDDRLDGAWYTQYRLVLPENPTFHFRLDVLAPPSDAPLPVVLTGDGCYRFVTEAVTGEVLRRGFALAVFSRTAIAADLYCPDRTTGLYAIYPEHTFGALAAWAWGFGRAIDAMEGIDGLDATRVAVTGHSRGGKAALLAGATDSRIALTAPNGSGTGGSACYRFVGPGSERLADAIRMVPYWYGPGLAAYVDREAQLPFDQHLLKALVAPRALLDTNGLDDLWANPSGSWQSQRAAAEVYGFLGAADRLGHVYRGGGHDHSLRDWRAFLDFAGWHLQGRQPQRPFDANPYPSLPPAHHWQRPTSKP